MQKVTQNPLNLKFPLEWFFKQFNIFNVNECEQKCVHKKYDLKMISLMTSFIFRKAKRTQEIFISANNAFTYLQEVLNQEVRVKYVDSWK